MSEMLFKAGLDSFGAGNSDAVSAGLYAAKASALEVVLQKLTQTSLLPYHKSDISIDDVRGAIAFARDQMTNLGVRKTALAATKSSIHLGATYIGGAVGGVAGTIIPVAGNIAGAIGGATAFGLLLGTPVSWAVDGVDYLGRSAVNSFFDNDGIATHCKQAAATLASYSAEDNADGAVPDPLRLEREAARSAVAILLDGDIGGNVRWFFSLSSPTEQRIADIVSSLSAV
jgi:hypothetical protein